jgi:hypothetical protein
LWVILLPFRLVGIAVEGVSRLLAAFVPLPAPPEDTNYDAG